MATVALSTTPTTLDPGTAYEVFVLNSGTVKVIVSVGALQQQPLRPGQSALYPTNGQAVTAVTLSGSGEVTTSTTTDPTPDTPGGTGTYAPISAAWTTATAYVVGELVHSSGLLYRVTTAHTSGGAFDGSKFTAVGSTGPTTAQAIGYALVFGGI